MNNQKQLASLLLDMIIMLAIILIIICVIVLFAASKIEQQYNDYKQCCENASKIVVTNCVEQRSDYGEK